LHRIFFSALALSSSSFHLAAVVIHFWNTLHQLFFLYCYRAYRVYFFLGTCIRIVSQMSLSQPGPVPYTVCPVGTTFLFANFRCRHTHRTSVTTFSLLAVWCRCAFLATLNIPHHTTLYSLHIHTLFVSQEEMLLFFPHRCITRLMDHSQAGIISHLSCNLRIISLSGHSVRCIIKIAVHAPLMIHKLNHRIHNQSLKQSQKFIIEPHL
jgi:hypothetical protein